MAKLTRDRILRKALELADERGVEALTMRELGRELGVEGMALYRHVPNKDAILDGILDLVLAETEPPAATDDWRADIRRSALSVHRALDRHPWATRLLMDPERFRQERLEYGEGLLARLAGAGFSDEETYHSYHVLDAYIYGYALWLAGHRFTTAEQTAAVAGVVALIESGRYPQFAKHHRQHRTEGPHREVDAFEVGLDLILDGLNSKA